MAAFNNIYEYDQEELAGTVYGILHVFYSLVLAYSSLTSYCVPGQYM